MENFNISVKLVLMLIINFKTKLRKNENID